MRVLMCPPLHYRIAWADKKLNPWMDTAVQPNFSSAFRQWAELVEIYRQNGVWVEFIPAVEGLSDMVFSTNAGWTQNGVFFASRMTPEGRKDETAHYAVWFLKREFAVRYTENPDLTFEGQGDIITTRDAYLYCHGPRNSEKIPQELERELGLDRPMLTLNLLPDAGSYHGDLALFYIRKTKKLLYCPFAFDAKSLAIIESLDCDKRPVPIEFTQPNRNDPNNPKSPACNFPLNAVDLGDTIIMPWDRPMVYFPRSLREWLTEGGVTLRTHDFSEFGKSGAGVKCVTLVLEE